MTANKGFTLLEVLIVMTILSVFLISAISISISSVRNLKSSENKIIATRYAEGLVEWMRGEKEADWDTFVTKVGGWCFNQETIDWPAEPGACSELPKLKTIYDREATISYDDLLDRITLEIKVFWSEGDDILEVPINTIFEKFE